MQAPIILHWKTRILQLHHLNIIFLPKFDHLGWIRFPRTIHELQRVEFEPQRSGGDRSGGESEDARGKRRAPGSVVGSVIRRREEEEDVGYDPHKPQYGRVASTVKIGTRRCGTRTYPVRL